MRTKTDFNYLQVILLSLGKTLILVCSIIVAGFMSFLSLKSTGYMKLDITQTTIFTKNNIVFYFILIVGFVLISLITKHLEKISSTILFIGGTCIFLAIGLFLAENAGEVIRSDPGAVLKTAIEINNGNFSSFEKIDHTHYMATFPTQMGLLTLFRLYTIFTSNPEDLFRLQVFLVCVSNFLLWQIANLLFEKRAISNLVILLSHLFLPSIFLTLWIYGDIPGLVFILLSLYFYIHYSKQKKIIFFFLSTICITIACLIRANYLIFLILLLLLQVVELIKKPSIMICISMLILPVSYTISNNSIHNYYEKKIQNEITYPSQKAWIVMGLNDKVASPGYWDGYTNFIREWNNYNDEQTEQAVNRDLNERMQALKTNPKYAQQFFYNKINVTWNEPTFQSIFVGPLEAYGQSTETNSLNDLYSEGPLYNIYNKYMAVIVSLIYLSTLISALLQLLSRTKDYNFLLLVPYIYLIGGFSFHLFWEVKSRYVFPYVYLLILLCATNFYFFGNKIFEY
ncbi:TPA: hypothetical protein ACGO9Q_002134, partial [Streptococcus suis]